MSKILTGEDIIDIFKKLGRPLSTKEINKEIQRRNLACPDDFKFLLREMHRRGEIDMEFIAGKGYLWSCARCKAIIGEVKSTIYDLFIQLVEEKTDYVAEEKSFHIFLNQTYYVTMLCSPSQLKELAVGHALSEGILKSMDEIQDILLEEDGKCCIRLKPTIDVEKRISMSQPFTRLTGLKCGSPDHWPLMKLMDRLNLPKVPLRSKVEASVILESIRRLNTLAETFRKTGGVHIAALYSLKGELVAYAEDVGRHNAADKVIGAGVLGKADLRKCFIASSGRLSGDIVLKSARMGIPVIASISAALSSGIEIARRTGITLIGFVRGRRMNIFTGIERIVCPSLRN